MDLIDRNNAITSICQWLTTLERKNEYIITVAEMKQQIADILCEERTVDAIPRGKVMHMIDEIQAEIEKYNSNLRWALSERDEKCMRCTEITFGRIQSIINEKVKEYTS